MTLQIRRLSHALGAEIIGVDLRNPLDETTFKGIRQALLDYNVVLFRGRELSRENHLALSRRFGKLDLNDVLPHDRHPDSAEVLLVTNKPKPDGKPSDSRYTGRKWHSDRSYTLVPAMASLLRAVKVPDVGGDTMFANMYLAYETLSDGMKKLIEGLHGIYLLPTTRPTGDVPARPVAQPVVRAHPETGRKALYIGEEVQQFVGMTAEESRPIAQYLNSHAVRHEFVYRHVWKTNDLLIWDNRSTIHIALGNFDESQLRHMERTTVLGNPSGYIYDDAAAAVAT